MGQIQGPVCLCGTTRQAIRSYGNEHAKVMLIGIAPGRTELDEGGPLVGPSGRLTNAVLKACGYTRDETFATNLICWRKDDPSWEQIECCQDRLADEIRQIRPKLIIALGALACERLTGRKISKARGAIVQPEQVIPQAPEAGLTNLTWGQELAQEVGYCVLPTWHPAFVLRAPGMGNDVVRDFLKIPRFLVGELTPPNLIHSGVVDDPQQANQIFKKWYGQEPDQILSADVETEDDSEDAMARVICMAVAHRLGDWIETVVFTRHALEGMTCWDWLPTGFRWMFHNGQFDTQAIKRTFGVWLPISEDTMLLSYNADERPGYDEDKNRKSQGAKGPGNHGLKQLCREYLQAGWYDEQVKGTLGKSLEEMAQPQLIALPIEELAAELEEERIRFEEEIRASETNGITESRERVAGLSEAEVAEASPSDMEIALSKPKKKKKPEVRLRYETAEEARARYDSWLQNFHKYNALDAAYTLALYSRIPTDRDQENYYKVLLPGANAYKHVQYHGITVDTHRLEELIAEVSPQIEEGRASLQKQAHELGFRNQPKLKSTTKIRDAYEAEHGKGTWPLGVDDDVRKKATPEEVQAFEAEHGPGTWPGYEPINLGSNLQVGEFLFKTLRIRPLMFTKKGGKPSTSADHMAMLTHPFCSAVAAHNQLEHIFNTYYIGAGMFIGPDGKFHAYPWLHGTTSGRRAYTGPAMQTFPQDYAFNDFPQNRHLARIREIITPDDRDMVLIEADYEQIEVWIGALLSGDQNMLADLQEPYESTTGERDPNYHSRVARNILRCTDPDDHPNFKAARQTAKTTTFSLMYLVEEDHFGRIINRPAREAGQILHAWYKRYDVFQQWQQKILRQMREEGEITTPFGYRRRFPIVLDHQQDKIAVNHPIQSTGGTLSLLALVELVDTLPEIDPRARVLLDVHDSLLCQTPRNKVEETCEAIRTAMCNPRIEGWPTLRIAFKIGSDWFNTMSEKKWLASQEKVFA